MKIIYIFVRRHCYTYDDYMFGLDYYKKQGGEIERWSAVRWTFPNLEDPLNVDNSYNCYWINSKQDLISNLERVKYEQCVFIVYPYHAYEYIPYTIRKYIRKYEFEFLNMTEDEVLDESNINFPMPMSKKYAAQLFFRKIIALCFHGILFFKYKHRAALKNIWYPTFGPYIYRSKYNLLTSPISVYGIPNCLEAFSKRNVFINSMSYDEYIISKNSVEKPVNGRFIVYIDDFVVGHSDFIKLGMSLPVENSNMWYHRMRLLFDTLEELYGCPVVVAAHPKAEYKGGEFGSRSIFYGKTKLLIRDAELVVIEFSTTFAVMALFKKPFLQIYSTEYFRRLPNFFPTVYKNFQIFFHNKQFDVEKEEELAHISDYVTQYNEEAYNAYICRYVLGAGTDDGKFKSQRIWELIN